MFLADKTATDKLGNGAIMYVYNYHTNPGVPGVVNHNERYLATQKSCSYTISTDDTSPNEFEGETKMDNKPHE